MRAENYEGREQAYVKHFVLKNYLEALALKVGQFIPNTTLNYIDGFSGPWQAATQDHSDTSPYLAMSTLREVRARLASSGLRVRCFFVERDRRAHEQLVSLTGTFSDVESLAVHGTFEEHIKDAVAFGGGGAKPFAFVFIDPTGWTGFPMKVISPLLRLRSECLINFMTKDISRFVDDDGSSASASFAELFGSDNFRVAWRGLSGLDREEAIVDEYCRQVRDAGSFEHVVSSVILNPERDRTHYHLIYSTRSVHGLITFREIERKAQEKQAVLRAESKDRREIRKTGQMRLFAPTAEGSYVHELRERYHVMAKLGLQRLLSVAGQVPYKRLVCEALRFPMVCEATLKLWLSEWREQGVTEFVGLAAKERVPKINKPHGVKLVGRF